jgi:hypothetical protein
MARKDPENQNNLLALAVLFALILALGAAGLTWWLQRQQPETTETPADVESPPRLPVESPPVIEYQDGEASGELQELTDQRKADLGVEESIDLVLKADESLKLGDTIVSMEEILSHIRLKRGDIIENNLNETVLKKTVASTSARGDGVYGIHVVTPGDNIWNIHFRFLKDYFEKRGITLSPKSDEATASGSSSGVGKILKFSENMVYVYNVRDHSLDFDLDMIHPLSKVIVFDMGRVFALLDQIDYENVHRVQFDGETLWIPAKQ